jgi:hypothetical protein
VTEVFNVLTDGSGRPLQNHVVYITLRGEDGNPFTQLGSEVIQRRAEDTDHDGRWTADLIPNAEFEAEGTYYHVEQRGKLPLGVIAAEEHAWNFVVPEFGGPYPLRDVLIVAPSPGQPRPPLPAHALGDHTDVDTTGEVAGQVLKFNGSAWVPAADNTGGGGGGGGGFEMHQVIPASVVTVPHGLGRRPAGVRLFSDDWATEFDEFAVHHQDVNTLTVTNDQLFTGWVTVS